MIHIYIYMHICIRICICTCTCTCIYKYVYIYIYIGGVFQALLDLNPAGRGPMGLGFRVVRLS